MEPTETESRYKTWIAGLDQGLGTTILRVFIFFCIFGGLFSFYAWSQFRGLNEPAAMEYSQLAGNIAKGKGFTTMCIRPADAWYLHTAGRKIDPAAFPDIRNAPAYPAVAGAVLRFASPSLLTESGTLFPAEKFVIVPLGILFSLISGGLLYLLASRLFTARIAMVSALVFFVTDSVLVDAISGLNLPMITMLATAVAYTSVVAIQNRLNGGSTGAFYLTLAASAVLCGLAVLAGYAAFVVIPPVLMFVGASLDRERWPAILAMVAVVMLLVVPWLVRNQSVSGGFFGTAPYTLLNHSFLYEGDSFDRAVKPEIHNVKIARALKVKLTENLLKSYDLNLRTLGGGIIICFFLVSFFFRFDRPETDLFRWCALLGIVLAMIVAALCGGSAVRMLNIFLPVVIIYGCALLFFLVEKSEFVDVGWETFLAGIVIVLTAVPAVVKVAAIPPAGTYPPYHPGLCAYVSASLKPDEIVCTDIPWATAWYGNRPSVLLPQSVDNFNAINQTELKCSGIYLTTETTGRPYMESFAGGSWSSWLPIINRKVPADFPFKDATVLPPGYQHQLFLSDKSRWKDAVPQK